MSEPTERRVTPLEASTALFGGVALYLLAHASAACIPLGTELNAVASLALVTVLIVYETLRFDADRARIRMGT